MPKVSVYLPDRLAAAVREYGMPISAICQRALEWEVASKLPILSLTPRSRAVLTAAAREAEILGDDFIGTEHLLLGLLDDDGGLAAEVLRDLGVADSLRQLLTEKAHLSRVEGSSNRAVDMEGRLLGYMFSECDGESILLWSDGRRVRLVQDDSGRIIPVDDQGGEFPVIPAVSSPPLLNAPEEPAKAGPEEQ